MFEYIAIVILLIITGCIIVYNYRHSLDWAKSLTFLDICARINTNCKPLYTQIEQMNNNSIYIHYMPNSCEAGMPHTKANNIIAIPIDHKPSHMKDTLTHEKVHIDQKLYPLKWHLFYKKYWNYELYEYAPISFPKKLLLTRRSNPDTNNFPFARWNNEWWMVPIYKNICNPTINEYAVKWYNEKTQIVTDDIPNEWKLFFGDVTQFEHPNEISAEYITDGKSKNVIDDSKAKQILLAFWNKDKETLDVIISH